LIPVETTRSTRRNKIQKTREALYRLHLVVGLLPENAESQVKATISLQADIKQKVLIPLLKNELRAALNGRLSEAIHTLSFASAEVDRAMTDGGHGRNPEFGRLTFIIESEHLRNPEYEPLQVTI